MKISLDSEHLKRSVTLEIFIPPGANGPLPFIILFDGQDNDRMKLDKIYEKFLTEKKQPFLLVTVYASNQRLHEYGVCNQPDYMHRGAKAQLTERFVIMELLPMLQTTFKLDMKHSCNAIAGYSLSGLMAFDMALNHPEIFKKVGVFSGSFWWRNTVSTPENPDGNRIIIDKISKSKATIGNKFWLQVGTLDEKEDRNNNGVIDAIDDTIAVYAALVKIGYLPELDIKFTLTHNGEHNQKTWSKEMPHFMAWAMSKKPF